MPFFRLSAGLWLGALCAGAAENPAVRIDTLELPPGITIRDPNSSRLRASQSEITLRPVDWEGRSLNLADLLAEQAGIETRRYGGVGSFQTVSVRGASGSRLQVFLDGVPMNSAGGGSVDLSKLSLGSLERIEIHKGMAPASEGGNGLGGVVHLFTRSHGTHAGVNLSAGSYGTQRHSVSGGVDKDARTSAFGSVAFTGSENDFRYLDRNSTPYNPGDDHWAKRENSAFQALETHAQVRFGLREDQSVHIKVADSRNAGGLPGREGQVTHTAGFYNLLTQYLIGWEQRPAGDGLLAADLSLDVETPEFHWTRSDPIGWTTGRDTTEIKNRSSRAQLVIRWERPLGLKGASPWRLSTFTTAGWESLRPAGRHAATDNPGWDNQRNQFSTAADLSFAPDTVWSFTLGGNAGGIMDRTKGGTTYYGDTLAAKENFGTHPAGRLGVLWKPGSNFSFFANTGWFYHPPGLIDLYGGRWGMVANPDLQAERGFNSEAGMRRRWNSGYAEACLFHNRITDALFYVQSANLTKPFNLDATLAQGLEFSLDQTFPMGLGFSYVATLQHTENLSDTYYRGRTLPNEPGYHHTLKTRLSLPGHFRLEHTWDYRDSLFRDPGNIQRIPPQNLHHLLLGWNAIRHINLYLTLQNITNAYYEDVYSAYPYPGRQVHVSMTMNL